MASRLRALTLLVGVAALSVACYRASGETRLPVRELAVATAGGGSVSILAEIADDDAERSRGLMFRKELKDGEGMLFVFGEESPLTFWMKDTLIPLSIAYLASDGQIREIRDMEPLSLAPIASERSCRYALEVPQGWFSRAGIKAGDVVDVSAFSR
ncbi:MAG: hypothetical protein A2Z99_19225 [Treponema sp. GWB1_62_6]|nr:MAG: hypothetical protein A2Y36_14025 [Treponema sp. GWA1_62_8]OHE66612.1 MAG: hypothetical protein A2001_15245 [Treponema sp. GWC1_61_84]OHE67662.1 MAG: hypothetical protein A2Z99_19225 [Treponema sp. GWB1_62_6]OHE72295.1 MAG: hypothetical protein A2413_14920 [Treponema sp. RIFOXYC1_FULL_61_9]HCM28285.1 DUF192 domain-containing protein [Treponema sp.]